jgi:hypothetical protein
MSETHEVEQVESYSTEAKANIQARVVRMRKLMKHITKNGPHIEKKKLIALYCLKQGISKSTAYTYLEEYMDAEIVVQYGEHIMTMEQYTEARQKNGERLCELTSGD